MCVTNCFYDYDYNTSATAADVDIFIFQVNIKMSQVHGVIAKFKLSTCLDLSSITCN